MITLSLVSKLLNACCCGLLGVLKGVISQGAIPNPESPKEKSTNLISADNWLDCTIGPNTGIMNGARPRDIHACKHFRAVARCKYIEAGESF
nr:unnamed protein product [Callosobruchus chinensis]